MSARMLRRALREKEAIELAKEESEEEVEERGGAKNIFDHLEGSVENEDLEEDEEPGPSSSREQAPASKTGKKTKKKKKGGKGKKKDNAPSQAREEEEDEDLSKLMEDLDLKANEKEEEIVVKEVKKPVLAVDPKNLRAEEELRQIFGSKVVNAVNRSEKAAQRRRNILASYHGNKYLTQPSSYWPRWDGGISMEHQQTTKDGIKHFKYVYSQAYMEIQKNFEVCTESHDPNTIALLLVSNPYHVDSLLALAELYKHIGEHQRASELLDRCLYSLECAWHPHFYPLSGKCRLDFSCPENKGLFLGLFRHMQHLGRRGCHRTALEVCKLLLSLDPADPTGAKLALDYYALRAEQFTWLESYAEAFYEDKLLPNFSFSLAIARFHLEQKEASPDATPSSDLLQQALMLHPSVLKKLVARTPIKEDSAWKTILKHPLFAKASAGGPTLEHLINIYVERNYLIWRYPELQAWLKAAAGEVVNKPESGGEAASWACARSEAFPADHNEYLHLSVSDYSDTAPTLPADLDEPGNNPGNHAAAPGDVINAAANLQDRNPALVFLQSLLPWTNFGSPNQARDPEGDDEPDVAGPV